MHIAKYEKPVSKSYFLIPPIWHSGKSKTWYAFLKSFDLEQGVRFVWSRKIGSSFKGDLTFLITLWVEWLRTQALESNINDLNSGSATSNCVIWDKWFKCFMSQFSLVAWLLLHTEYLVPGLSGMLNDIMHWSD